MDFDKQLARETARHTDGPSYEGRTVRIHSERDGSEVTLETEAGCSEAYIVSDVVETVDGRCVDAARPRLEVLDAKSGAVVLRVEMKGREVRVAATQRAADALATIVAPDFTVRIVRELAVDLTPVEVAACLGQAAEDEQNDREARKEASHERDV